MTRFGRWSVWTALIVLVPATWVFGRAVAAEPAAKPYRPPPTLQAIVNRSTYIVVARTTRLIYLDEKSGEILDAAGASRTRALEAIVVKWIYPNDRQSGEVVRIATSERFVSDSELGGRYIDKTLIFFLMDRGSIEYPSVRAVPYVSVRESRAEPAERLDEVIAAIRTRIEKGW